MKIFRQKSLDARHTGDKKRLQRSKRFEELRLLVSIDVDAFYVAHRQCVSFRNVFESKSERWKTPTNVFKAYVEIIISDLSDLT